MLTVIYNRSSSPCLLVNLGVVQSRLVAVMIFYVCASAGSFRLSKTFGKMRNEKLQTLMNVYFGKMNGKTCTQTLDAHARSLAADELSGKCGNDNYKRSSASSGSSLY